MSDVREVTEWHERQTEYDCELCGDTYPSIHAAMLCEDRDIAEAKEARHSARRIMRPARHWEDD